MINKNELIDGTLKFISQYQRLPYLSEDDIAVDKPNDKGAMELKPYRAVKYVKEYFDNQDKYSEYLIENKLLTYDKIAEIIDIDKNRLKKLINKEVDKIDNNERRRIELFFNKDYYPELGKYNSVCEGCSKRGCKQVYWVMMIGCNKYKKSERKQNKNTDK